MKIRKNVTDDAGKEKIAKKKRNDCKNASKVAILEFIEKIIEIILKIFTSFGRLCKVMDYVKWGGSAYLCNSEVDDEWWVLWIWQWSTSSVVATEVSSTIDDDTLDWYTEATVQADWTIRFQCLLDTINQASVLTISIAFANISTQTSTGVIQWIDKAKWCGSSSTTRSQVTEEVTPELCLLINTAQEDLFVDILEGKVEGLGWEISDDISQVTTPESTEALFLWNTNETIDNAWKWLNTILWVLGK